MLNAFTDTGKLPALDDTRKPRATTDNEPVCAIEFDLGSVTAKPVTRQVMIAYDEIEAIKYFGKPLKPYWRRNGDGPVQLFKKAAADYADAGAQVRAVRQGTDRRRQSARR